jgi:hypothetical protein
LTEKSKKNNFGALGIWEIMVKIAAGIFPASSAEVDQILP